MVLRFLRLDELDSPGSFETPDDPGPTTSYAAELTMNVECRDCVADWPADEAIYALTASSVEFRIGWGEAGGQHEGWFPWWSGTIRLR